MSPQEQRRIIEFLIYKVYVPEMRDYLQNYLINYTKTVHMTFHLTQQLKTPAVVELPKLDMTPVIAGLVENILEAVHVFDRTNNPK